MLRKGAKGERKRRYPWLGMCFSMTNLSSWLSQNTVCFPTSFHTSFRTSFHTSFTQHGGSVSTNVETETYFSKVCSNLDSRHSGRFWGVEGVCQKGVTRRTRKHISHQVWKTKWQYTRMRQNAGLLRVVIPRNLLRETAHARRNTRWHRVEPRSRFDQFDNCNSFLSL